MGLTMKILSVRQPWAWLIVHGHKDIENRTWHTKVRGHIQIHASKGLTKQEYADAVAFAKQAAPRLAIPDFDALKRGGIVGTARVVDCVSDSDSPWFVGPFGFMLADPYPLPFVECAGALGFFELP